MNTYTIVMDNRELAAENSSTLISDLPMGSGGGGSSAGYMQMNVHPNPYGNTPPNMNPVPPGNSLPKLGGMSEPEFRLPSRDIPIDTMRYNIDEQTRPNYIPVSSRAEMDYMRDVDDDMMSTVSGYGNGRGSREKRAGRDWNAIIAEIQMPVLVGILFFVFQSVAIDRLIVRYLTFLSPMGADGNLNLNGLLLKSAAFAGAYYLCMYAIENV